MYPEGHRSTRGESLPLKRGMLHYAHSRKMPVQVVMGANKEAILSEKHQTARLRQTVAVGYSEVIRTEEYPVFDEFMAKVQATWDGTWERVFSADWATLRELPDVEPQFDYPLDIKIRVVLMTLLNIFLCGAVVVVSWRAARAALSLLGPLQVPVVVLVLLYIAAGFYVYSQPVDALTVHRKMVEQLKHHAPAAAAIDGAKKAT